MASSARRQRAQAAYDPRGTGGLNALTSAVGADGTMVEPARLVARLVAAQGLPAYVFRFSYVAELRRANGQGAIPDFTNAGLVAGHDSWKARLDVTDQVSTAR